MNDDTMVSDLIPEQPVPKKPKRLVLFYPVPKGSQPFQKYKFDRRIARELIRQQNKKAKKESR